MKKTTAVKIISLLGALIVAIGGFFIKERGKSERYMLMIQNSYSEAHDQLNESLNNISLVLTKTSYATSAKQMSSCAAQIFSEAELAKTALSKLPVGEGSLETVYKFLSQAGNYALAVSKSVISGNALSESQRDEIKLLSDTAKTVSKVINDSDISFNNAEYWAKSVEEDLAGSVDEQTLATSLTELEENLADYPTLIYDGPYSDHILEKTPLMTSNAPQFSQDEAMQNAIKVSKDENLRFDDMQNGKIECYRFVSDNTSVSVSKNGGYTVFMRKNRTVGEGRFSYDQALSRARKFLEENDFLNMIDTYYYTDNGVCVINFAYLDGKTICYTDLIKVGVAMDNGEIMFFESSGYLTNHTDRAFAAPTHTEEEAAQIVSSDLEIEKSSIALIPTDAGGEVRCYEFLCRAESGEEILVYINTLTLEDEQIYILLKTDGGTLVK